MVDTRLTLAGFWIALMLVYLLGDVLRIFAGDFEPGKIMGVAANQWVWLGAALVMLVPIVMLLLTLTVPYPAIRWVTIVVAILLALFNVAGLPYPGMYDNVLIAVSIVFNALTVWIAWRWIV